MRNPALALALSAAALALSGSALAAPDHGAHRGPASRVDAEARTDALFAKLDTNDDGLLDSKDRAARKAGRFAQLDADHDGSLSPEEFAARAPEHSGKQHFGGARHGHRGMALHGMRGHRGGSTLRNADANSDGAVSRTEFHDFSLARFDRADADHDGALTNAERKAAKKAGRDEQRGAWRARHGAAGE